MWKKLKTQYYEYMKRRETIKQLESLTDKELSDIGINRCDIKNII